MDSQLNVNSIYSIYFSSWNESKHFHLNNLIDHILSIEIEIGGREKF